MSTLTHVPRGFNLWKSPRIQSSRMCFSGTVWLGCQWTTRSRTFPVQMWPTCCWRTSSSGLTMRLRWLHTMGRVWALSAIKSLSGLCREVSSHIFNIIDPRPKLICWLISFLINECVIFNESAFICANFKQASVCNDNSWLIRLGCNVLQVQCCYYATQQKFFYSTSSLFLSPIEIIY